MKTQKLLPVLTVLLAGAAAQTFSPDTEKSRVASDQLVKQFGAVPKPAAGVQIEIGRAHV